MSAHDQNRTEMLEQFQTSGLKYGGEGSALAADELAVDVNPLSALEELSLKVELCLKKQQEVSFISREIAEIVKKSS